MAAPFSIETGYPAATDVQSAFPAHETAFRQTVSDWLSSISDPATGLLLSDALPAGVDQFDSGTGMVFLQDAAPTGWTASTGNDHGLRIVDAANFGTGSSGTVDWAAVMTARTPTGTVGDHTLTTAEIPGHTHTFSGTAASAGAHTHTISGTAASAGAHTHTIAWKGLNSADGSGSDNYRTVGTGQNIATSSAGAHTHTVSGSAASAGAHTHTVSGTTASSGSGGSHNHTFTGTSMSFALKARHAISCTKD